MMNFKKLKKEELQTVYPSNKMSSLANMTEAEVTNYLSLYFLYRKLFTEYMIQKLQLKEYDEKLVNSGLNFPVNIEDDMDVYQYFSSDVLKYIYIRNNVYIERLSEEEKKILKEKIDSDDYELDETSKQMIENTYEKVIFEDVTGNGEKCITLYGPNSNSFLASNNSLVIGIRYDEFAENGLDDEAWDKLHDEQLLYLFGMINDMKEELVKSVSVPVAVLKYNEYSVIKKNLPIKRKKEKNDNEEIDV